MQSTFVMKAHKIDKHFYKAVKELFGNQEVEIRVSEVSRDENGFTPEEAAELRRRIADMHKNGGEIHRLSETRRC